MDVERLAALRRRFGFKLYLDDTTVLGAWPEGRGTAAHFRCDGRHRCALRHVLQVIASLGGFVAGDKAVINAFATMRVR